MKVKDILALAASNLGREDLAAKIYDAEEDSGELTALLRCYNLIENEIALDYFPLKAEENFAASDRIDFSRFSYAPVFVSSVKSDRGEVSFELYPSYLKLDGVRAGENISVRYHYTPAQKQWKDDSEFEGKISARLLSFGVASEYLLATGQFSEAALWDKKFRDAIHAAGIVRKKLCMRSRRWV